MAAAATNWHSGVGEGRKRCMSLEKVNNLASTQIFQFSSPQYLQGLKIRLLLKQGGREVDIILWISGVNFCKFLVLVPSVAEHWSKLNCAHSDC